jgi:hypothetical protein
MSINNDQSRFHKIVKGKIRQNLKKFINNESLIGKVGKNKVSIPIPNINLPRFKFDDQQSGGIGQGDGEVGDTLGQGQPQPGKGKAGQGEGEHMMEVEISIDELAEILGEELQLPNILPKGNKNISQERHDYTGIQKVGPEGLKHFKRTFKESIKRQIVSGGYDFNNPIILPEHGDKRYKSQKPVIDPMANAVIIYIMDVSGSMGEEQKSIVRTESFWIDTWLSKQYKGLETRFIIHDIYAKEVDRETFFNTSESGGTMISSALTLCNEIIKKDYPPNEWNIYVLEYSDGDNWSEKDTNICIDLIQNQLLPTANMFAYIQVDSQFGSGQFLKDLQNAFPNEPKLILSQIDSRDDIMRSIKEILGKGH